MSQSKSEAWYRGYNDYLDEEDRNYYWYDDPKHEEWKAGYAEAKAEVEQVPDPFAHI